MVGKAGIADLQFLTIIRTVLLTYISKMVLKPGLIFFILTSFLPSSFSYTWPSIEVSHPSSCGANQSYDITAFACFPCGKDARPKRDGETRNLKE